MGIFDKMRAFQALSPIVEVELGDGELVLQVQRLTPEESAGLVSVSTASCAGASKEQREQTFAITFADAYWKKLRSKIVGWRHNPAEGEEKLEFSAASLESFLQSLSYGEQQALIAEYQTKALRQAEGNDSSETDSSTPSKDESKSGQEATD